MNDWTTKALAYLEERKAAGDWQARGLLARRDCPRAAPAKTAPATVAHHSAYLHQYDREMDQVKAETWAKCLYRAQLDHRGRVACEACHKEKTLEPHHLELVLRTDRVDWVMALCAGCHRMDPEAAHHRIRQFALRVVLPWAKAHGYELPNRKEYRDA